MQSLSITYRAYIAVGGADFRRPTMCDEADIQRWAKQTIDRRRFAALTGAAAVAACAPGGVAASGDGAASASTALKESMVSFATEDGTMDAFFVHPTSGAHPAVIFWPDIAAIRESKRMMARRLAGEGYAVLVVNPYYRDVAGEQFADFAEFAAEGGFQKVGPWREKLSSYAVQRDAKAAVAWLDAQDAVDSARGIGTQGYCMGGPFTVYSAHSVPGRVKAAASFHGGGLVREDDQSPHKLLADSEAAYLFAIARNDDARSPQDKTALADATTAAGRPAQVEVFDGDHGWCVPDSPAYAQAAAEKAWADLLALYADNL